MKLEIFIYSNVLHVIYVRSKNGKFDIINTGRSEEGDG